ncbi:MAG: hypothetical protein RIC15_06030 [Vicingaceae bacterium]
MKNLIQATLSFALIVGFALLANGQDILAEEYHANGKLKSTIKQFNNEIEVISYHENGNLKQKYYFVDFKRHGKFEVYHANGTKHMAVEYIKNIPNGNWDVWNESGQILASASFENGKLKSGHMWDDEGNPIAAQ